MSENKYIVLRDSVYSILLSFVIVLGVLYILNVSTLVKVILFLIYIGVFILTFKEVRLSKYEVHIIYPFSCNLRKVKSYTLDLIDLFDIERIGSILYRPYMLKFTIRKKEFKINSDNPENINKVIKILEDNSIKIDNNVYDNFR